MKQDEREEETVDQYDRAIGTAFSQYLDEDLSDNVRVKWGNLLARLLNGKMSFLRYSLSIDTQDKLGEINAVLIMRRGYR